MDIEKQLSLLLEAARLDQLIRETDLEAPKNAVEERLEHVRLVRDGRIIAGKKRAARNRAIKRNRIKQRRYKQRQEVKRWEHAANGNWWPKLKETWRKRKLNVTLTEEEWNINVSEYIPDGMLFNVNRYDTSRGISLDNIYLTNNDGVVLFDGASTLLG